MAVTAVVLAAGRGERLAAAAAGAPKGFVALAGRSIVERSLSVFTAHPEVGFVLPVVSSSELARFRALGLDHPKLLGAVAGGEERQDSVRAALDALPANTELVAVHDAARCLLTPEALSRVLAEARASGAALLAIPASDTIKRVRGGSVIESPPRSECWAAQTPQVFRVDWLREAHQKAAADGRLGTDEAELVASLGVEVQVVPGDPENLKITHPADLATAEAILDQREARVRGEGAA